jgi:hypothetical protein
MAQSPLAPDAVLGRPRVLGFLACGAVVRRSAFLAVGGFSPRLVSALDARRLCPIGPGMSDVDLSVPLELTDVHESPILLANHSVVQWQADEFVPAVSQWAGPPLVSTPDEQLALVRSMSGLPVHTPARVSFNRRRAMELIALLQDRVREHDGVLGERERKAA